MRIGQRVVYQENHRSDSVSNVIDDVLLPLLHASVASNVAFAGDTYYTRNDMATSV